ncbi:histidine phosphatase family protein [Devosia sp. MC532]|uniref:histidine phosphatase family protein n=1 Tax=Devosia sp. MC532 TaxID=2799788 RepID=UPI0032C1CC76
MIRALYITHPQVEIDPDVAVPQWGLSSVGRDRAQHFAQRNLLPSSAQIFSSAERKAIELAHIIGAPLGAEIISHASMDENDRSATGFLAGPLFEEHANQFFAHPDQSVAGWERAVDAQARIVSAIRTAIAFAEPDRSLIFCGHGGVGTLLKCHLGRLPISRSQDQQYLGVTGGGNCFIFDPHAETLESDWMAMESLPASWTE